MDNCEPRNTENFEEMTVSKFKWVLRDVCNSLPSLKKASKHQAIHGIILSLIFLVLGAVGGWLLISEKLYIKQRIWYNLAFGFGATSLLVGTLFLIYSLILLSSVWNDQGFRVYQIIKCGCLILLYLELIVQFVMLGMVILLADHDLDMVSLLADHDLDMVILLADHDLGGVLLPAAIGFLVLDLFLTVLAIYAIHNVKPKIVSLHIFIMAILFIITIIIFGIFSFLLLRGYFGGFPVELRGVWPIHAVMNHLHIVLTSFFIFVTFLVYSIMDYYLKIFALHVNMMTITPVNNHHVNC